MICKESLIAAGLALCLGLGSAAVALAHSPGSGAGDPYGWHYGWHHGGGMGPGMMMQGCPMAPGYGMMGPGMMGPGMMGPGMMQPGYGPQGGDHPMMGPGMGGQGMPGRGMQGQGMGPGMMQPSPQSLGTEDVTVMLERRLAWQGNPHVKLGKVEEKDDDTILAEIVTQDGSLVERLEVDRRTGWMRMIR